MTRYTSATDADRERMLEAVGVGSIEELFDDIPKGVRLGRELDLPDGKSETEVFDELASLASRNSNAETELTFLGAGMYDHYVPALVDAITQRSEFLTPYTPYQPEISQGGLQSMFEFQTAISELTAFRSRTRRFTKVRHRWPRLHTWRSWRRGARSSSPPGLCIRTLGRRSPRTAPASARM